MADVISKSKVLASGGNIMEACPSSPSKKPGASSLGFSHLPFSPSSLGFEPLRSPSSGRNNTMLPVPAQMTYTIGKAMRWWEKGLQPSMREVESANDLVYSLLNAGNKLVVVHFFSPGCGGCKALHPKICQLAEMNSEVLFLQVNYEEHKSMCYSLNVHVLPFFRFYRGSKGRLCSFSCTNATIKKFKDAIAKHNTQSYSMDPPKGLEESELMALASNRDMSFHYTRKPEPATTVLHGVEEEEKVPSSPNHSPVSEEKNDLLTASR